MAIPYPVGLVTCLRRRMGAGLPLAPSGHPPGMERDEQLDEEHAEGRASGAPPEEANRGSEDPVGQAEEILADSEIRRTDRDAAPGIVVEHRQSDESVEPPDA